MPTKKSSKHKAPADKRGIGPKGSRRPPAVDEGPKWRGGGKKGENEQTSR